MTRKARSRSSVARPTGPALQRLEVRNLATIAALELEFQPGFSVFSGETGAGKSIIVDALGLLLGARGNTDLIRSGEDDLLVTGFWRDEPEAGTGAQGGIEHSASRRLSLQGRSTARLDGEVVSVRELQEWAQSRLTIHWQHSAVSLLSPANQRALLDRLLSAQVDSYTQRYRAWQAARDRLEALRSSERLRARQLDLLSFQAREIAEVAPQPGEEEPLQADLTRLGNLEAIAQGAAGALALLAEAEENAVNQVAEAIRSLTTSARYDHTSAQLQQELRDALDSLQAVVGELRVVAEEQAPDAEELSRVETRLGALGKLRSKYGPTLEEVLAFQVEVQRELEELSRDEQDAGTLDAEVSRLYRALLKAGRELDEGRAGLAPRLASELLGVIRQLGMPHARLEFRLSPLAEPGSFGTSDVSLLFTANPGEELAPLAEVASGGELARVMLAISTVLGAETPVVVFDEVDAGIGGSAAQAVAAQLASLAGSRQVFVVTHLAQIAARADHHYKVEKQVVAGRTVSSVRLLSAQERLPEIARMLSGHASEAALEHARELLTAATQP